MLKNFFCQYFRRDNENCDECRYCCTLPFCTYSDDNGGENVFRCYASDLYYVYINLLLTHRSSMANFIF